MPIGSDKGSFIKPGFDPLAAGTGQYSGNWNLQTQGQAVGAYTWPGVVIPTELYSWGYNSQGQLGDGTLTTRSSPVQIGALNTWLKVGSGFRHGLSVKTDGTLWT